MEQGWGVEEGKAGTWFMFNSVSMCFLKLCLGVAEFYNIKLFLEDGLDQKRNTLTCVRSLTEEPVHGWPITDGEEQESKRRD